MESTLGLKSGYCAAAYDFLGTARSLGWGDEELEGPSSRWVDTDIYTDWSGYGADCDVRVAPFHENLHRQQAIRRLCWMAGSVA